jgi:hypothetical protein
MPRKSTALLELNGAFKRNPQRERGPEPKSGPLGEAPERMSVQMRALWSELVGILPDNLLQSADRWSLELAARLMYKFTLGTYTASELNTLRSLLGALGMTPLDRGKLVAPPAEKPTNRFANIGK